MSYQTSNVKKKFNLEEYVTVNERIASFYKKFPEGRILTDIVSWQDGVVVMKATVYRDNGDIPAATGHAYEKEGSSFINNTSYIENCESSCIGRALAVLGFEIKKSIASYEEVANANLNQNKKEKSYADNNFKQESNNKKIVTAANKNLLLSVASQRGYTKDVFESMLEKKYNCNLSNIDMSTFNIVYSNLNKAQ